MRITFLNVLIAKFLKKSFSASNKFGFPVMLRNLLFKIHYKYMEYLLDPYFEDANKYVISKSFEGVKNSNIIWMFWWQGYDDMPKLVKKCIDSVKRYSNSHHVILITKRNVKQYAKLPDIIYKKVYSGNLDLTHFSDLLRFNLLDLYGGLWIDSTIYCTSNITSTYFNYLYTSGGYRHTIPVFVKGRWTEFLIGGKSHNSALCFLDKFLQIYFHYNNRLPTYFLADYALDYSYNHNLGNFKNYINDVAKQNNPNLFELAKLLNCVYDIHKFRSITSNTNMFKLTYKVRFNGVNNTFYKKLIINE